MNRLRIAAVCTVLASVLVGCSNNTVNSGNSTKTNTTTKDNKASQTKAGSSADTHAVADKYLYNNSYKDLADSDDKGTGLFSSVKLRDPLKAKIGEIPETPPDESFENKKDSSEQKNGGTSIFGIVVDNKKPEDNKPSDSKPSDSKQDEKKQEDNRDKNNKQPELPEPKDFLFTLKNYVGRDLIENGSLIVYSYDAKNVSKDSGASIEYTISHLKVSLESLDYKNDTIKELFKDDNNLLSNWNNCYIQLTKVRDTMNKIKNSTDISQYKSEIDIDTIYKTYNSFEAATNNYLTGYEPNKTKDN